MWFPNLVGGLSATGHRQSINNLVLEVETPNTLELLSVLLWFRSP